MKKDKKILIISLILVLIAVVVVVIVVFKNNSNSTNSSNEIIKVDINEIKSLLKDDYKIKTIVYGNLKLEDSFVKIDKMQYYLYKDKEIKSMSIFTNKVNNLYVSNVINQINNDTHVYNEMVEVNNKLYINPSPKCNIPEYDGNVKIKSFSKKKITYVYKNNEYMISIEKGKYKLNDTPFTCGDIILNETN